MLVYPERSTHSRGRLDVPRGECNHTLRPNPPIEDFLVRTRRFLWLLLAPLAFAALPACQKDEKIESYDVPHPERQKMRLFAAIVPHGEHTWFVRLSGPEAEIDKHKPAFDAFVKSIRIDDNANPPIHWTTPDGWKELGGDPMAAVAFRIKAEQPLNATLTHLGKFGEGENTLTGNVNRWRKQLSLPPATDEEIARTTEREDKNFIVALSGIGVPRKAAPPPMEHRPMEHPPIAAARGQAKAGQAKDLPFRYEVPKDWRPTGGGQFSLASYEISDGPAKARVSITSAGGSVLDNLKRWRHFPSEAGLPPIPDAEVLRDAQKLTVVGTEATFVDYSGKTKRILGVILPQRDQTWFVKMAGPPDLVGRHKADFEAFVKSFRLATE
jgi:hypothetical protein